MCLVLIVCELLNGHIDSGLQKFVFFAALLYKIPMYKVATKKLGHCENVPSTRLGFLVLSLLWIYCRVTRWKNFDSWSASYKQEYTEWYIFNLQLSEMSFLCISVVPVQCYKLLSISATANTDEWMDGVVIRLWTVCWTQFVTCELELTLRMLFT